MAEFTLAPLNQALAVVPDDVNAFRISGTLKTTNALYVGSSGDVNVVFPDGSTMIFTAVPAGTWLPIKIQRVNNAYTSASNMVALFQL
jgi:hypothetical protein